MSDTSRRYETRINQLRQFLTPNQALLLSTPTDITYLTNFKHLVPEERESFLLLTAKTNYFFHASFSPFAAPVGVNAHRGCGFYQITPIITKLNQENNIRELLIDKSSLFVNEYDELLKIPALKIAGFDRQHIWKLRTIKDNQELTTLKKAAQLTAQAMQIAIDSLSAGMTEIQLKDLIETKLKEIGSEKPAFPTIVAFGPNSALPHHQPTNAVLQPEMAVLIDLGATVEGYHGDMTRTTWFGDNPAPQFLTIQQTVKSAYQAALAVLNNRQPTDLVLARDIDQAARDLITKAGYGKEFIHTTGHGLGLDLHESLSINWNNIQPLLEKMVITIEPGIYLMNKFGYRYENTVIITATGAEEITLL